jgi:SAM-dependent methyltransferase
LQIDPGYEEAQTNLTLVRKNIAKLASAGALPASGAFLEQARAKERSMEAYADIIQEGFPRESVTAAPPDGLVTRIMGSADINAYRDTGKSVYLDLSMILLKYFQKTWTDFDAILDFGVGSGRIARWLPARAQAKLYGVDVHAESIRWCRKHLIGAYSMHADDPPLAFAEDTFDCVYGFAVFSHMDNETAGKWIRELHRVIKPGGIVLASAHLSWASSKILNPEEWARYQEQGYVYREFTATGADIVDPLRAVNAFVTERHFWEMWKDDFELIGITAGNSKRENVPVDWEYEKPQFDMGQGVAVLRKIT